MTFQKGVKFRIYPNREQRNLIDRTLGCSRLIYNKGLAMQEDAFKNGKKCGYKQTSAMLTALKQDVNYAFLKEVDSIALQQALRNLDTGYTNFFEHRTAHPKFKSKKSSKQSYRTLNIGNGIRISNKRIRLPKIGWVKNVKNKIHGWVSEWSMEPVLKTGDAASVRGFESHPYRHSAGYRPGFLCLLES